MKTEYLLFYFVLYLCYLVKMYASKSIYYMNIERPVVTYYNETYLKDVRLTCRRANRQDPRYYLSMRYESLMYGGNNITVDFHFYQFLTNRYRPSFVEIHSRWCDLIDKDTFLGTELKKNLLKMNVTCPMPPGKYHFTDMTVPYIPKNFPFSKGRIYTNLTYMVQNKPYVLAHGYVDMEIRQWIINKKKEQ